MSRRLKPGMTVLAKASSSLNDRPKANQLEIGVGGQQAVLICVASSRYLTTTSDDRTTNKRLNVRSSYSDLAGLLQIFVLTSCKSSINTVTNPNTVSSHT
jgi:phage-related holin